MAFASNSAKRSGNLLASNCAYTFQDENSHSHDPSTKANLFVPHSEFPKANFVTSSLHNLLHPLQQLIQALLVNISQTFIYRFYFCLFSQNQ